MTHSDTSSIARRRFALAVAALVALVMATSSLALATRANADPVGDGSGASGCTYNGDSYNTGDRISVISGAHYDNYYCGSDGVWHKVEQSVILRVPTKVLNSNVTARATAARK